MARVPGKRKGCKKGKSCGATCIDPRERCVLQLGPIVSKQLTQAKDKIKTSDLYKKAQADSGRGSGKKFTQIRDALRKELGVSQLRKQEHIALFKKRLEEAGVIKGAAPVPAAPAPKPKAKPKPEPKPETAERKYTPRAAKGDEGTRKRTSVKGEYEDRFKPERNKSELLRQQATNNKQFLEQMEKNLPKGTKLSLDEDGILTMTAKTKSGDTVLTAFNPESGYAFKVNNTMVAGSVTDRTAQLQVASTVRSHFDALVRSLPVGSVVETSAYVGDDKGAGRVKAYERVGFSTPSKPGMSQFAVKQSDGSMAPAKGGSKAWLAQMKDPNAVWFAEAEDTSDETDEIWRQIIFGDS